MKINILFLLGCFLAWGQMLWAQTSSENYILFDQSCMKKLDYERSQNYHDLPFMDFYFEVSPHHTYILRVLNVETYKDEIEKLDRLPITCENPRALDKELVQDINAYKKAAYILVKNTQKEGYVLYQVHKIGSYIESQHSLSYEDPQRSFVYNFNETNKGVDLDSSEIGKVFFLNNSEFQCERSRVFRSFDRQQQRIEEKLHFISNVGLYKIELAAGYLQLKSINGMPVDAYVSQGCKTKKMQPSLVDTTKTNPTGFVEQPKDTSKTIINLPNPFETGRGGNNPITKMGPDNELSADGYYFVKEGENLWKIAKKFDTTVDAIMQINGMTSNAVGINQRIKVIDNKAVKDSNPLIRQNFEEGIEYKIHVVRQGENLWRIAEKYNTSDKKLKELNALTSDKIDIGQEIIVEKKAIR